MCDVLIVGQGLAGTLVGHALEQQGASFVVLDKVKPYSASPIAAGIIHPVSGRRFVKAWNYDQLLPVFKSTYAEIEQKLNRNLLQSLDLQIHLSSTREENDLLMQAARYDYSVMQHQLMEENSLFQSPRLCYTLPAFKLDIQSMVDLFRIRWMNQNNYFLQLMDYNKLQPVRNKWQYEDIIADQVVFCEGSFVRHNPWFNRLPVVPNKGQVFLLKNNSGRRLNSLIKKNMLFADFKDHMWAGATYEWEFDSPAPDSQGWKLLNQNTNGALNIAPEIHAHVAGLRPTVPDRKPLISSHPIHPNLWAINGFGTKGASVGPWVVRDFIRLLTGQETKNLFAPDRLKEYLS